MIYTKQEKQKLDRVISVFAERLNLEERDIVRPDHPETIVARGTAIAIDELFPGQEDAMTLAEAMERLDKAPAQTEGPSGTGRPLGSYQQQGMPALLAPRISLEGESPMSRQFSRVMPGMWAKT